jgi:hypothetical protein
MNATQRGDIFVFGALDGTRTRTVSRRILSPLRMPFRHGSVFVVEF